MKNTTALALATSLMLSTAAVPAMAQDYLTVYGGMFDFTDDGWNAAQAGVEYRMSPIKWGLSPIVGITATDDESVYAYGGINWEIPLIDNTLYLTPSFTMGAYAKGDGKDLGGAFEFKEGVELSYQFNNAHRLGVVVSHMSNAHIYDKNPGQESILVTYSLPMGNLLNF